MFKRENGNFYVQENGTYFQKSLKTKDPIEAEKLLHALNESRETPDLNLELGSVYLRNADPALLNRKWKDVITELSSRGKASTQARKAREFRSKAYDIIRDKLLIRTTGDDFRAVMKRGGVSTNSTLHILHNTALENGWIRWHIIPPAQWPECKPKAKRGITQDEHDKIIAAETNEERRNYYQMLWETGAAQTDGAMLSAEMFDWKQRVLSYQRTKTGVWCNLEIGESLEELAKKLPHSGLLFPKIGTLKDKDRSAEFARRRRLLNLKGISLHSYRYAWAERAFAAGISERYAQGTIPCNYNLLTKFSQAKFPLELGFVF